MPDYLPSVPRDVRTGREIQYDPREGGYGLNTDLRDELEAQGNYPVLFDYQFPDEYEDAPDDWQKVEDWTADADTP